MVVHTAPRTSYFSLSLDCLIDDERSIRNGIENDEQPLITACVYEIFLSLNVLLKNIIIINNKSSNVVGVVCLHLAIQSSGQPESATFQSFDLIFGQM